ncbi:hypothetical protein RR48_03281 [Papilio machaon]|uniref:Kazal-like domain-containing protein n=1 Tax=Papilio machaon TaxID=76193 RepID=A0A0N0PAW8_PAPMA|nr:hypothetical protein RR48_03281 [Papilio machaon]
MAGTLSEYVNERHTAPWKVRFYPKKSLFKKSELIDRGCNVFLTDCPSNYKKKLVCGRHYDGELRTFTNYCALEFENCNSWRKWSLIKETRC